MRKIDILGKRFERLEVVEEYGKDKWGQIVWRCICDCGKEVFSGGSNLRRGKVKSCGCYSRDMHKDKFKLHGLYGTPTYNIWKGVVNRCYQKSHTSYCRYGAVGVTVCDRWLEPDGKGFLNFLEDMGERPEGMELNRTHGAKVYCKENCEWVGLSLQAYDKGMSVANTSGRTGVNWDKHAEMWCAQLNKEGKVYKKRFKEFEDACRYREMLELEHFGFTKE